MKQTPTSSRVSRRLIPSARIVLGALAFIAAVLLVLPVIALGARAPWSDALARLFRPGTLDALRLSLVVSTASVVLSLALGFPIAWVLARCTFPGRRILRTLVLLPMVFPPVVGGVALLAAFGSHGICGSTMQSLGIRLPFTTAGAIVAATFVSCPFMILSLESGLQSIDRRLEDAAATLGASDWMILRRIVVRGLGPALRAGIALTWARALGEFGATITFAGSHPGRTRTLPLAVYELINVDVGDAILLGVLLVAFAAAVLLALSGKVLLR